MDLKTTAKQRENCGTRPEGIRGKGFLPGRSGNPQGRPRTAKFSDAARRLAEPLPYGTTVSTFEEHVSHTVAEIGGTLCQCPAMKNGQCRLHGGRNTGPKTPEGIERIRRAVTKHGRYSKRAEGEWKYCRNLVRNFRELLAGIEAIRRAQTKHGHYSKSEIKERPASLHESGLNLLFRDAHMLVANGIAIREPEIRDRNDSQVYETCSLELARD